MLYVYLPWNKTFKYSLDVFVHPHTPRIVSVFIYLCKSHVLTISSIFNFYTVDLR